MAWHGLSGQVTCTFTLHPQTRIRHTLAAMAVLTFDESFDASLDELRLQNMHKAISAEIPARTKRMGQAMPR